VKQIEVLFWDVGGVLLTNAWDHSERACAVERFHLDKDDFETRHRNVISDFEEGKLTLDEYLRQTVFWENRHFTPNEFKEFMFSLSKPKADVLNFARQLAKKYFVGTINNESRELNEYRIRTFHLSNTFRLFVSSCYVGLRKPEERIYRLALDLVQKSGEECCFIDDRAENVKGAAAVGMRTVVVRDIQQLKSDLQKLGVEI